MSKTEKKAVVPPTRKIPGLVGHATISSNFTMHIPKSVAEHFNLEVGDELYFYTPLTDFPEEATLQFNLMAVLIRRIPKTDFPLPIGKQKVRMSKP
ncbi:MAG: AbrB/MazE/SpoVT family DNA-binding domain-containing protein [Candidatus Bathyarchaeia archaeon]